MKKFISILLTLAMICTFAVVPVSAETTLTPAADGYYEIATADDYVAFVTLVNEGNLSANARLTEDIDLSGKTVKPIGKLNQTSAASVKYTGIFDGNKKVIRNLAIEHTCKSDSRGAAMFGALGAAEIKDLGIENAEITLNYGDFGATKLGAIVAGSYGAKIQNCYVKNSVIVAAPSTGRAIDGAGAIAGYASSSTRVENCYAIGNTIQYETEFTATGNGVSAFVGYTGKNATVEIIKNSYAKGNIIKNAPEGGKAGFAAPNSTDNINSISTNSYTDQKFTKDKDTSVVLLQSDDEWKTLASTLNGADGTAWKADTKGVNGGAPRLAWEKDLASKYDIIVSDTIENGTVTVDGDKAKAEEGETVNITVTPADNYVIGSVKVNGTEIESPYTSFTMPGENAVITAEFVPLAQASEIEQAVNDITEEDLTLEDKDAITEDLTLPLTGLYGTTISWESDSDVITVEGDKGIVERTDKDETVKLTATFTLNDETLQKEFTFTVLLSEELVAQTDAMFITGIPQDATITFKLPVEGLKNKSEITWASDNAAIEIKNGYAVVKRSDSENISVVLTATVKYGQAEVEAQFPVNVPKVGANEAYLPTDVVNGEIYYLIGTADQYTTFVDMANADPKVNAMLTADIDMSGYQSKPIGKYNTNYSSSTDTASYKGIFDGKGHIIKNLSISVEANSSNCGVAMFGGTRGATIKNLGLVKANIADASAGTQARIGGIVGYAGDDANKKGTIIENCFVRNSRIVQNSSGAPIQALGGIAGQTGTNTKVKNTYSRNNVLGYAEVLEEYSSTSGIAVGGVVGYTSNSATVANFENCYEADNIIRCSKGRKAAFARLGYNDTTPQIIFTNCYTATTGDDVKFTTATVITQTIKENLTQTLGTDNWKNDEYDSNGGYPKLKWEATVVPHTVTVSGDITGGTVTATPLIAGEGTTINLTIEPELNHTIEYVKVNGTDIEAPYTSFDMPNEDVVVTAGFRAITDLERLEAEAAEIDYDDLTTEDADKITQNLTLPTVGDLYGATITWKSDVPASITDDGVVTRKDDDIVVKMTATFTFDTNPDDKFEKIFTFTVIVPEEAAVKKDAELISAVPETATANFTLPTSGEKYGSSIVWTSDDSSVAISGGNATVTRPSRTVGDRVAILTATLTKGGATKTVTYKVTVPKVDLTAADIKSVLDSITWASISSESKDAVTQNLTIKTEYGHDIYANWSCDAAGYIDEAGVVMRPAAGSADKSVKLTVKVGANGVTEQTKSFDVKVKAFTTAEEALEKAYNELVFNVISGDSPNNQVGDMYLPTDWRYGTSIEWTSDDDAISVSETAEKGTVTNPQSGTKTVNLTAKITLGELERTKTIPVTLRQKNSARELFSIDSESLDAENIVLNQDNVKAEITADPTGAENKVIKLTKDSSMTAFDQKGVVFNTVDETCGGFEFTTKLYFANIPERDFRITGIFNTGDEIRIDCEKTDSGVKIAGSEFAMGEWHTLKVAFDTADLTYKVYVDDTLVADKAFRYASEKKNVRKLKSFTFDFVYDEAVSEHVVYADDVKLTKTSDCKDKLEEAIIKAATEFVTNNDLTNVTDDLALDSLAGYNVTISNTTSDYWVITPSGKVSRPMDADETHTFTIKLTNSHGASARRSFSVLVRGGMREILANTESLKKDFDAAVGHVKNNVLNYVTSDISILTEFENGSTVTYSSSDTSVFGNDGKVTRPTGSDKTVTFTITAERNGEVMTETLSIVVKAATTQTPVVIVPGGNGGTGGGISKVPTGGGLTTSPSTVVNPTPTEPVKPSEPTAIFSDIESHWAKDYIEKMYEAGVVNGNDDGTFAPDQTVTREAFITMLIRALDLELVTDNGVFTDVNENDWFAPFVNTAFKNNIVSGISETEFGITRNISRQDMCVMVYNALKEKLESSEADTAFADDESISDYAKTAVYALKENGIVNGRDNNNFVPSGTATRAEAAKIICSIVEAFVQ